MSGRARRERYLAAMGIVAWRLRHSPPDDAGAAAADADVVASLPADRGAAADFAGDTPPHAGSAPPHTGAGTPALAAESDHSVWETLAAEVSGCTRCVLHRGRTQAVLGVGRRDADLMVIGEAPGAEEDRQGEPFVGRAGQLLNAMLRAIGLRRQDVYIANILKCRPPGNRDPKPEEAASCTPYLERQIALVRPRVILAVGRISAQWLLQSDAPIGRLRGRVCEFGESAIPLVVTYHPAYLLRTPLAKAKAWEDLRAVRRLLEPVR